jgi:hypothetical protein
MYHIKIIAVGLTNGIMSATRGLQPKSTCTIGLKPRPFSFLPLVKTNGNEYLAFLNSFE